MDLDAAGGQGLGGADGATAGLAGVGVEEGHAAVGGHGCGGLLERRLDVGLRMPGLGGGREGVGQGEAGGTGREGHGDHRRAVVKAYKPRVAGGEGGDVRGEGVGRGIARQGGRGRRAAGHHAGRDVLEDKDRALILARDANLRAGDRRDEQERRHRRHDAPCGGAARAGPGAPHEIEEGGPCRRKGGEHPRVGEAQEIHRPDYRGCRGIWDGRIWGVRNRSVKGDARRGGRCWVAVRPVNASTATQRRPPRRVPPAIVPAGV